MSTEMTPKNWNEQMCKQLARLLQSERLRAQENNDDGDRDHVAECSGDEENEAVAESSVDGEEEEVVREADADMVVDGPIFSSESESDETDDEIRELLERKKVLSSERQRLQEERERRRSARERRKNQLRSEVQVLETEVAELAEKISMAPSVAGNEGRGAGWDGSSGSRALGSGNGLYPGTNKGGGAAAGNALGRGGAFAGVVGSRGVAGGVGIRGVGNADGDGAVGVTDRSRVGSGVMGSPLTAGGERWGKYK